MSQRQERKKFEGGGQISAVEYQKTNPDRVNIFIEGEYAFSVAAILAAERKLKAGVKLSPEDTAELQAADLYNQGLSAALQLLAMRPRSEAEISQRLRKRYPEITPETIRQVVERLRELNYLNDASFARFWVENRAAFAPRGRNLLRQELMKKGVPRDIIDAIISEQLDAQTEESEDDESGETLNLEESQALEMARKKALSYAGEEWPAFYRKLGGFLQRRGYGFDIVGKVSKQVWKELKDANAGDEDDYEYAEEDY
ncbi:MAG TPA: RecX family transcriptional regulator [Chloroflexia bacterium]|nr:RecX family transcriptional regulator [Chloroflexia bacterium]